jgi:putative hydrolase of the HAD superfamily
LLPPSTRALFFDLDGTLIDDEAAARRSAEQAALWFEGCAPGFEPALVAATFSRLGKKFWTHRIATGLEFTDYRTMLWESALQECSVSKLGLAGQLTEKYGELRETSVEPYEEALPVVEALASAGFRLVVITNGISRVQRYKLEAVGLVPHFEALIASSDVNAGKPDLIIFEAALTVTGIPASETWHVGDNLATDVGGALNAGIHAVWLNRHGETAPPEHPKPDFEITSLRDLLPLLGL